MRRVTGRRWCSAVRFAWSCPVLVSRRTAIGCGRRVVFLERTLSSRFSRWTRLLFLCGACPDGAPAPISRPYFNASTRLLSPFRPIFSARKPSKFRAKKPVTRSLNRRTEWSVWNPFGTTGGTPTHSRRTVLKLEQLPCARQALVRVPESNTKYGGKSGKPRGRTAP